jgi:hypothetical protein
VTVVAKDITQEVAVLRALIAVVIAAGIAFLFLFVAGVL